MAQLYKYQGTISQFSFNDNGCGMMDMVLCDIGDWDKAPVRVTAYSAIAKYLYEIEMTDAEERYIKSDWYYDRNLFLHRIEIPTLDGGIAKIITSSDFLSSELAVFGPQEYLDTNSPEQMNQEQSKAWYEYRFNH